MPGGRTPGGLQIALHLVQPEVDDLAERSMAGPVQVGPPSCQPEVRLVDESPITRNVATRPSGLDELRGEPQDPAVDGDVINVYATLGEQFSTSR